MMKILRDFGGWTMVLVNIAIIIAFYLDNTDSRSVLLAYWMQGVIIGLFHYLRIINVRKYKIEGHQEDEPEDELLLQTGSAFNRIYGFFHFVYLVFIFFIPIFDMNFPPLDLDFVILSSVGFFISHLIIFTRQLAYDKTQIVDLGKLANRPIVRIIPLHISIIAWGIFGMTSAFIIFLVLKAIVDTYLHYTLDAVEETDSEGKFI